MSRLRSVPDGGFRVPDHWRLNGYGDSKGDPWAWLKAHALWVVQKRDGSFVQCYFDGVSGHEGSTPHARSADRMLLTSARQVQRRKPGSVVRHLSGFED